jgi:hypothetical protein
VICQATGAVEFYLALMHKNVLLEWYLSIAWILLTIFGFDFALISLQELVKVAEHDIDRWTRDSGNHCGFDY